MLILTRFLNFLCVFALIFCLATERLMGQEQLGTIAEYAVQTRCGKISVWDSQGSGPAVLCVHGNSSCKEVFERQFASSLGSNFRLIAIDLPGHGKSENALDPKTTYSLPGYADIAMDVLEQIGVQRAAIIGWSLGGHIALDLLKRWPGTQGVLITGTPPIPLTVEGFKQGFVPSPCERLMGQETFTREDAETFMELKLPFLIEAAMRTHGMARPCLISSMQKGEGGDQKEIVETSTKPTAVVCGSEDTGINNGYIQTEVAFNNLWDKQVYVLQGGHAVFWEQAEQFNEIAIQFLTDINRY